MVRIAPDVRRCKRLKRTPERNTVPSGTMHGTLETRDNRSGRPGDVGAFARGRCAFSAWHPTRKIDGIYGPKTEAALKGLDFYRQFSDDEQEIRLENALVQGLKTGAYIVGAGAIALDRNGRVVPMDKMRSTYKELQGVKGWRRADRGCPAPRSGTRRTCLRHRRGPVDRETRCARRRSFRDPEGQ